MSTKKLDQAGDSEHADPAGGISLGQQLRQLFETLETAPVPDEIKRLVHDLETRRRRGARAPRRN